MVKVKKIISVFTAALLTFSSAPAQIFGSSEAESSKPIQIVTTIFPEYDWVKNILGDNPAGAEVTMLLDNGVDLHSYQLTAADILKISNCDLFVYVGGESDEWVEGALKEATNQDMLVVNLLEALGDQAKEEEIVEGMEAGGHDHDHDHDEDDSHDEDHDHDEDDGHDEDHDHDEDDSHDEDHDHDEDGGHDEDHDHDEGDGHDEDHDHDEDDDHDHDGAPEYDEHVWLSLRNASFLCDVLANTIALIDPENADIYTANAAAYEEKLSDLDAAYQAAVDESDVKLLLFGDRFPFRYLVDDYGLDYYAAFVGCSAETEASFETITFLANKVNDLSLHSVMTIEGSDRRIAETIVQNTEAKDQKILTMDSMQSTTSKNVENGASYYSIMEQNLEILKEALQ